MRLIASGGTIDKHYDELKGQLGFSSSFLPEMIQRARLRATPELTLLPPMDSLDMQDADRQRVLQVCQAAPERVIVILHGTDTMTDTAQRLTEAQLGKTIVLTGAMIPYEIRQSDALYNLGFACASAQLLPNGIYIAMNGEVFNADKVRKNRDSGMFERID